MTSLNSPDPEAAQDLEEVEAVLASLPEPESAAQPQQPPKGVFEKLADDLSLRGRLATKRREQSAMHAAMSMDELLERYCPASEHYIDWPRLWPMESLGFREQEFKEKWYRRRAEAIRAEVSAPVVMDMNVRLLRPKHCICGCVSPEDHMTCWISGNTLFHRNHPDHNKIVPCICKASYEAGKFREWIWESSGLNKADPFLPRFSDFKNDKFKGAGELSTAFREWSSDSGRKWLFVYGRPGTGKTHLCKAATAAIIGRNKRVAYIEILEFIAQGRRLVGGQDNEFSDWIQSLKTAEYLLIDDVGQEYSTEWTASVLREIIHYRYERGLPLVLTSNRAASQLKQVLGEATVDRFTDSELCKSIEVTSKSQRSML